jgi:hypothetical protein
MRKAATAAGLIELHRRGDDRIEILHVVNPIGFNTVVAFEPQVNTVAGTSGPHFSSHVDCIGSRDAFDVLARETRHFRFVLS